MRRFFKLTSAYQRAVIIVSVVLLLSVPLIVSSLGDIGDPRPQAATTETFTSSSISTAVWRGPSYPPEISGSCVGGSGNVGQAYDPDFSASEPYVAMRTQVSIDTSSIPDGSTINSATLRLGVAFKNTNTSFTLHVRNSAGGKCSNWGGNPPTANLVGTKSSGSIPGVGSTFDVSINTSAVNTTGVSTFMLSTDREENDTVPTGSEGFSIETGISSLRPKLIVSYTEPSSPPTVSLSASPTSVSFGGSTTLTWSTTNSPTSCSASGGWSGSKSTSGGSQTISNLTSTTTFSITCSNSAGSDSDSATVNVGPAPDTTSPSVSINSPGNGQTVSGTVTFSVSASDNVEVTSLVLKIDGSTKKTCSGGSCSYSWNTTSTSNGSHTLSATASDAAGNSGSDTHTVTVSNSTGSPPGDGNDGDSDGGSVPPPPKISDGVPTLPPPPPSIPGVTPSIDPEIVNILNIKLSVPYLLGEKDLPIIVGGFAQEIKIKPDQTTYELDVRGAKFKLGGSLSVRAGSNGLLTKQLNLKTKAPKQSVDLGSLYLGDIDGDDRINNIDTEIFVQGLKNQETNADINADKAVNSIDWAVLLANFGKSGN